MKGMRDILAKMLPEAETKESYRLIYAQTTCVNRFTEFRPGAFSYIRFDGRICGCIVMMSSVKVAGGTYDAGKTYGLCRLYR